MLIPIPIACPCESCLKKYFFVCFLPPLFSYLYSSMFGETGLRVRTAGGGILAYIYLHYIYHTLAPSPPYCLDYPV